jgi:ABC-2 type transport system permease protein
MQPEQNGLALHAQTGWQTAQDYGRLYGRMLGLSLRSQMQYRASFVMLTLGHLITTGVEFLGIWALFHRFGNLRGWTLPEVALFYGMANVAFAVAEGFGRGFDTFSNLVKSGDFDRLLLRPRHTAFQVAAQELQLMRAGRLLQGGVVLSWAVYTLGLAGSPAKLALILATISGGACLFYGLLVLQATLSFWTIESLEIVNILTYGGTETAQFPLTIYRPWFRWFFTFIVPLACMNYLPAGALLERPDLAGLPPLVQWTAPALGLLFLLVSLQIWKLGVRHYRSTGS